MTTRQSGARPAARKPRPRKPTAADLGISPEVAYWMSKRGIPLPSRDQVPTFRTPEPRNVAHAVFSMDAVDDVAKAFRALRHTQGRWAGHPLNPDPWQWAYILAPVYGWLRPDSTGRMVRVARTEYVDVPRKNGKTTLAGGQAMYLTAADGEPGAQVYALAAGKDQAQFCFRPVREIAEKSPVLGPLVKCLSTRIVHHHSHSYFAVVSSMADLIHGANIHGAVVDELHIHKTRDLVDAVETGTGARQQPLVIFITTPDDGRTGTIYDEKRRYMESVARGAITDPTFYGVAWSAAESEAALADEGLSPFSEAAWKRANPGYGVSPTREFLQAESRKAQESPANLARFLRLHLGLRTKQSVRYIPLETWDASAGLVDELVFLDGRDAYGGLDLASVSDLAALCWLFPDGTGGMDALWRFWTPEDNLVALDKRTAGLASVWARQGVLRATAGNVLDTDWVLADISRDAERFHVRSIGFDRWGSNDVTKRLGEGGLELTGVGQGFASMNAPLKELLRLTLARKFHHGGNPLMRWMVDNLAVRMDPAGNVKPDKDKAGDKIDGVTAACNALAEYLDSQAEESGVVNLW